MKHVGVLLWWLVLLASVAALTAGYASGRATSFTPPAGAQQARLPGAAPAPIDVPQPMQRALFGAHSLDQADAGDDAAGVAVAVERAAGWAPAAPAAGITSDTKLAVIVYNAGRASTLDARFIALPAPVAFAIDTDAEQGSQTAAAAVQSGKPVLAMLPAALAVHGDAKTLQKWLQRAQALHASGVLGPLGVAVGKPQAAELSRLLAAAHWYAIDAVGADDPSLYDAARAGHVPSATRDLVVDTRDDDAYVTFMLQSAADLSRRTGVAIALLRPVMASYRALEQVLPRWEHDGVNVVDPAAIVN